MRQRISALVLLLLLVASMASAATTAAPGIRPQKGLGRQQITPVASTALTLPALAKHVVITIRTKAVYWTDDGTVASAANGQYLPAGTILIFENDRTYISQFRFIDTEEGASVVFVQYSGDR